MVSFFWGGVGVPRLDPPLHKWFYKDVTSTIDNLCFHRAIYIRGVARGGSKGSDEPPFQS